MTARQRIEAGNRPVGRSPGAQVEQAPPTGRTTTAHSASPLDIDTLRQRLQEAEETLHAIRVGEVDALVVHGPDGPRTYTLVTADQTYRFLVEQMREGALTLASDGLVVYSNARFAVMVGLDRGRVPGQHLEAFVSPGQCESLRSLLREASEGNVSRVVELERDDGSVITALLSLSVLRTDAFDGFCAIVTDLTEQTRRDREAADERLTRAILEYAGQAILVCDDGGRVLRFNRMGGSLCGYDCIGRTLDSILSLDGLFARVTGSPTQSASQEVELRPAPEEPAVVVLVDARPLGDGGIGPDGLLAWVVTLTDITDRKRAEAERACLLETERELRAAAEHANRTKSDFLAMMSHELRTPLNAIAGHVQLIELGLHGAVTDAQRDALGRVQHSQQQLMRLITDVLNFARLEAGHLDYVVGDVNLAETLGDLPPLFAPQLDAHGVVVATPVTAATRVIVRGDSDKVTQIARNLMSNAIKFTAPNGRITLSTGIDQSRGMGYLEVSDTGRGIPADKVDTIFEPFVQIERSISHAQEGVGLGLAISRTLARAMGGDLVVQSVVGAGSTFTLRLPLAA